MHFFFLVYRLRDEVSKEKEWLENAPEPTAGNNNNNNNNNVIYIAQKTNNKM